MGFFALPLAVYPDHPEPVTTKSTLWLIWVGALFGIEGVRLLLTRSLEIFRNPIMLPALALFGTAGISLVGSPNPPVGLLQLALMLGFFGIALFVAHHVRSERDVHFVLGALMLAGCIAAVYGILQYYGVLPGGSRAGHGSGAMVATFGNKNYLGGYLSYLLLPGIGLMVLAKPRGLKLIFLLAVGLYLGALLLVRQDAVWVALLASGGGLLVGITVWHLWRIVRRNRAWIVALAGSFAFLFLLLMVGVSALLGGGEATSPAEEAETEGATFEELFAEVSQPFVDRSARIRLFDWRIGLEMLRDHPLLGVGLGAYKLKYLPYKLQVWSESWTREFAEDYAPPAAQAHNDYLQWAAETGLLGVLVLLFALGHLVRIALSGFAREPLPACHFYRLAVLAGLGTIAAHALVDFPFHLPASALVAATLLGLLYSPFLNGPLRGEGQGQDQGQQLPQERGTHLSLLPAAGMVVLGLLLATLGVREFRANEHMQRGIALALEWSDFRGAQEELERSLALSLAPSHNALLLGAIAFMDGRYAESASLLEQAARGRPSEMAYFLWGQALLMAGELERGREVLDRLLKMRPRPEIAAEAYRFWELAHSPWALELLALQRLVAQKQFTPAQDAIERLRKEPLDAWSRRELLHIEASLAQSLGNAWEAQKILGEALQIDPEDEWAYLRLAQVYLQIGEKEKVRASLTELRSLLKKKQEHLKTELSAGPPSPEQQILRARLDLLRKLQREANRLVRELSS